MKSFRFIEAASRAYAYIAAHWRFLLQLALVPVVLRAASYGAIIFSGLEDNILRQGLVLLPSYLAEGWLIALALRVAFGGSAAPGQNLMGPPLPPPFVFFDAGQSLRGCAILYALIKLCVSLVLGFMMSDLVPGLENAGTETAGAQARPEIMLFTLLWFVAAFWSLPLFWLYVPVGLGGSMRHFLQTMRPPGASWALCGFWLVCFMPAGFALVLFSGLVAQIMPDGADRAYLLLMGCAQSLTEVFTALVSALGLAYLWMDSLRTRLRV